MVEDPERSGRAGARARRRRRVPIGWLALGVVVLVAVWGAWCAFRLLRTAQHVRAGEAVAGRVRNELSAADLGAGRTTADLAAAHREFAAADGDATGPWMAPLRILPWVGRQVHSVQALAAAATTVTGAGQVSLSEAQRLLQAPHATAAERASDVRQLAATLDSLRRTLDGVQLGPDQALLPTLAAKRRQFAADLATVRRVIDRASGAAAGLTDLLTHDRTYLLVAANNAEMRDGSGMFLEVGDLTFRGGTIRLGRLETTAQLATLVPQAPLTGDLAARWGSQHPNEEWRNLALSPQFDANAALAAAMWQHQTGQHVDGVVCTDVGFVQQLLTVTGPVRSGETTADAGNVVNLLLEAQYVGVPVNDQATAARRERLGQLAGAVFDAMQAPGISLTRLATALSTAAEGRHLLLWAGDPAIESDWRASGASGVVSGDSVLLGVMNQGGNKLDPYLSVASRLRTARQGGNTVVTVTATLTDQAPEGLPPYVLGNYYPPRHYVGTVALDFPRRAGDAAVVTGQPLVAAGPDGPATVLAVRVQLQPGQQESVTFRFALAGAHGSLTVVPSARIPPVTWNAPGRAPFTDRAPSTVRW